MSPRNGEKTPRAGSLLARELTGDLPCIRCQYNLRGLTVRGMCPECGTSVRTTLLSKIDPLAKELRPLFFPRLTSIGLIVWSWAAAAAAMCNWALRLSDFAKGTSLFWGLRAAIPILVLISGIASLVIIRPQDGLPRAFSRFAAVGVALYAPLIWVLVMLHRSIDVALGPVVYGSQAVLSPRRIWFHLFASALIFAILACLRPILRQLAARWLLMRVGAVDRQTTLAMLAVVGVWSLGDVCLLVAATLGSGGKADGLRAIGSILIEVGSLLFTLGLFGVCYDTWRLREVLSQPPLSLDDLTVERKTVEPRQPQDTL